MNKKVSKSLSLFFVFVLTFTSVFSFVPTALVKADTQTFVETFDNLELTGSSYVDGKFIGVNGIEWSYIHARGGLIDQGNDYSIDGKGLMLRRSGGNSKIFAEINGGIKNFSVDLKKAFTTGTVREVGLFINDELIESYTLENNSEVQNFSVDSINIEGKFILEIRHLSGGSANAQITIDNITWTNYDDGGSGGDPKVLPVTANPSSGEVEAGTKVILSTSTIDATVFYAVYKESFSNEDVVFEEYAEPIQVDEPLTIKTYATKEGLEDSDITEFSYTIKAPATVITIAEARNLPKGQEATVRGVVTWVDGDKKYIQDDTAGIVIDYYKITGAPEVEEGDFIQVTGNLNAFNELITITPNPAAIRIESKNNTLPVPKKITIEQANNDTYESQLIEIEKATIGTINTGGDTVLTDSTGSINIFRIPSTELSEGDEVELIAILSRFTKDPNTTPGYQLRVRKADDIQKILGPDTENPVIAHTPVTKGNIEIDLEITAKVTDNRKVELVTLYYRIKGQDEYEHLAMLKDGENYSVKIPKSQLVLGELQYYIEASDGTNTVTAPEDKNIPYEVKISDEDIVPPVIINLTPVNGTSTDDNLRPEISAEYSDTSGIDVSSIKLYLDGIDITAEADITESKITYVPKTDLSIGNHTAKLEVSDMASVPQKSIVEWGFYVGKRNFNFYFGQLHSHTNLSDGTGTVNEAFRFARDEAKADFFAVTDHSNWFDNEKDLMNENITDVSQSNSAEWKQLNSTALSSTTEAFVGIPGYEMTWSGSTGGWGHINTFNTPWFASRSNSAMNLQAYYNKIAQWPESINQLNHPGKTFGDFADFGFYAPNVDKVVQLIEVGNGEGPVRGSGYFPSYGYYTRALDKGWHLAPSNNQDNHKGNWILANTARTVIVAEALTRDSLYDAIRDLRVYSTEDNNLEIMYKVNDQPMGSQLNDPDKLNVSISILDPDANDNIAKVELISDGGAISASRTFSSNKVDWDFELDPRFSYYYVRVTQEDKDIAVTAPIWVGEVSAFGLSNMEASQSLLELGSNVDITATVFNNESNMLNKAVVDFYVDSINPENKIGSSTVTNIGQGATALAKITWKPENVGEYNIYAVATIEGADKTFTASTRIEVVPKGSATKVMIDYAHKNHYVSGGDYSNKIESFREMLKNKNMIIVENHDTITDEALNDIDILIITSPQPIDRGDNGEIKRSKLSDEEIQAVKRFTDKGGSLIVTSRANYNDGKDDYQNSIQGNKLLNAIGSNIIFNSDQVVDYTQNGGQQYRLYFNTYTSTKYKLTSGLNEEDLYSFYSGCSVLLKDGGNDENVDFIVKGHSTTKNENAGNTPIGFIEIAAGNVYGLAAEVLSSGAKIIASGTTFFSDFEMSGDNRYSNIQIADKVLDWLELKPESEVKTIKEVRDGMPGNFGEKFIIEGRITSMSEAYSQEHELNNAFFEVIYVQDETGGITVFGVSQTKLPLGAKVRVTGTAGQYQGDYQLQIKNENTDLVVLDSAIQVIEPKLMSTKNSMLKDNEGWLVRVQGKVTRIDAEGNSLYIDDGTGEARVYLEGYIGDGTKNGEKLGIWDPAIRVGDTVSAIGLASTDSVGARLRVRNTTEIVRIEETSYPIGIEIVKTSDVNGNLGTEFELGNMVMVNTVITNKSEESKSGTVIFKLVDSEDRTYAIGFMNGVELNVGGLKTLSMGFHVNGVSKGKHTAKVYVWDSFTNKAPLSEVGIVEFTVK
ncbi:CehA/McbA family metallohydrolase [Proteiniborus sp. MB09-C3]|uniref:CehA/McbA family metallohydrolase n=1 Tax=Proteiniborus sp. MB09-C3 TaxID=3050072 RepID=UPI00255645CD|nr:CehA/McbA family metallohydrolase [Proteiniborus sp. MB09-C3]WIV12089.1 CehA/McbA family metallohydrolase [Proteiniborus sp. MB09-C3]